nr:YdaS family helix-turn-helix protein [Achromobacter ruhlandii]
MEKNPHISLAVALLGGPVAAARKVGATNYQTVQQWERSGNVPAEYAVSLERESGVSRKLLCRQWRRIWPDLADSEQGQEVSHAHP